MPHKFSHLCRARFASLLLIFFPLLSPAARQVTLAWDPSPDNAVIGYRIHYGNSKGQYGSVLDVGASTTATITNLSAGSQYFFTVTAYSGSNMDSDPSNEITFSTPPPVAPTVQITSPAPGSQINGPVNVNIQAQASDPDGVLARIELYNGAEKVSEAVTPPFSAVIPTLEPGTHSLSAVAVDQSGGRWPSAPVNFEVVQLKTSQGTMRGDGAFEVTVTGAAGSTNRIWYSNDLVHWELLQTIQNTGGSFTVSDPNAKNVSQRFYKVTSP